MRAAPTSLPTTAFEDLFSQFDPGDFTFALIKPDGYIHRDEILQMIQEAGLSVADVLDDLLSETEVRALYYEHVGRFYYARNAAFIGSGPVRLLVLTGKSAQKIWREDLMPKIRQKWGNHNDDPEKKHLNLVHGSDSPLTAFREVQYFFG